MPADPSVLSDALRLASILFSTVGGVILANEAMKGLPVLFSSYFLIINTLADLEDPANERDASAIAEHLREAVSSKLWLLTGGGFLAGGILSELTRAAVALLPTLSAQAAIGGSVLFVALGGGIVAVVLNLRPKLYAAVERLAARHERLFQSAS